MSYIPPPLPHTKKKTSPFESISIFQEAIIHYHGAGGQVDQGQGGVHHVCNKSESLPDEFQKC